MGQDQCFAPELPPCGKFYQKNCISIILDHQQKKKKSPFLFNVNSMPVDANSFFF